MGKNRKKTKGRRYQVEPIRDKETGQQVGQRLIDKWAIPEKLLQAVV